MEKLETNGDASGRSEATPFRVRLPGFIANEEIGLGSVIKHPPTSAFCRAADAKAGRPRSTAAWFSRRGGEGEAQSANF